jgi:Rad3-related DNA helicase
MRTICTAKEAKGKLSNFRDREFRKYQLDVINFVTKSKRRIKVVKARTGFGKSLAAMVCGVMAGDVTYLVQSKFLQMQIVSDFPEVQSIWGRGNYECATNPDKTCELCLATKTNPCKSICPYKTAKEKALEARYRCCNFSYFINEVQFAGRFSGNPFTVVDEADALENSLLNNVALVFTERNLFKLGLQDGPRRKTSTSATGLDAWKSFGEEALRRSKNESKKIQQEIDRINPKEEDLLLSKMRELKVFVHIAEKSEIFLSNMDKHWIYEEVPRYGSRQAQYIFRPTWLSPDLSDKFLFRHSDSWLLISATFLPMVVLCKQLGIDQDEVDYMEVPSTFDPERSPVHVWPVANLVSSKMEEETPKLIKAIKTILSWHKGERGLIHTVSYKLCKDIIEGVNDPRLITHDSSNRKDIMGGFQDEFGGLAKDAVLVSPSAERGISLDGDKCRFIICCKMAFLSLGDKVVAARLYGGGSIGKLWYRAEAMLTLEQQCGRGMRGEDDEVVSYLLDFQIDKVYKQSPLLWSQSFRDSISWDEIPPELLEVEEPGMESMEVEEW